MKPGIELIAEERARQVAAEGWTAQHDDAHVKGELAMAGAAYAVSSTKVDSGTARDLWPWERAEFNPKVDPLRDLVRAAALIAAEIDRLQRRAEREKLNASAAEEQP